MDKAKWITPVLQYRTRLCICFFVMLVLGTLYANGVVIPNTALCEKLQVHDRISAQMQITDGKQYFVYILNYRLLQAAVLLVVLKILGIRYFLTFMAGVLGGVYGMLLAVESAMLGAIGIVYGLIVWFPQILFYAGIFWMLYHMGQGTYYNRKQMLLQLLCMITLLLAGCLTEAFWNPKLMYYCNQYLVPVTEL